jgi:excinuclease UvrABC ATPase subunit
MSYKGAQQGILTMRAIMADYETLIATAAKADNGNASQNEMPLESPMDQVIENSKKPAIAASNETPKAEQESPDGLLDARSHIFGLEFKCDKCDGTGKVPGDAVYTFEAPIIECPDCLGAGKLKYGEKLL